MSQWNSPSMPPALAPMSPYGNSKLMSEIMLKDVAAAHGLKFVILRYFNVAGADPKLRTGQATVGATHLIKVAVETALGLRPQARPRPPQSAKVAPVRRPTSGLASPSFTSSKRNSSPRSAASLNRSADRTCRRC